MRIWREVRNFASQKKSALFSLFLLTSIVHNVCVCIVHNVCVVFVSAGKNTLLLSVTVCEKVVPRLNHHDDVIE